MTGPVPPPNGASRYPIPSNGGTRVVRISSTNDFEELSDFLRLEGDEPRSSEEEHSPPLASANNTSSGILPFSQEASPAEKRREKRHLDVPERALPQQPIRKELSPKGMLLAVTGQTVDPTDPSNFTASTLANNNSQGVEWGSESSGYDSDESGSDSAARKEVEALRAVSKGRSLSTEQAYTLASLSSGSISAGTQLEHAFSPSGSMEPNRVIADARRYASDRIGEKPLKSTRSGRASSSLTSLDNLHTPSPPSSKKPQDSSPRSRRPISARMKEGAKKERDELERRSSDSDQLVRRSSPAYPRKERAHSLGPTELKAELRSASATDPIPPHHTSPRANWPTFTARQKAILHRKHSASDILHTKFQSAPPSPQPIISPTTHDIDLIRKLKQHKNKNEFREAVEAAKSIRDPDLRDKFQQELGFEFIALEQHAHAEALAKDLIFLNRLSDIGKDILAALALKFANSYNVPEANRILKMIRSSAAASEVRASMVSALLKESKLDLAFEMALEISDDILKYKALQTIVKHCAKRKSLFDRGVRCLREIQQRPMIYLTSCLEFITQCCEGAPTEETIANLITNLIQPIVAENTLYDRAAKNNFLSSGYTICAKAFVKNQKGGSALKVINLIPVASDRVNACEQCSELATLMGVQYEAFDALKRKIKGDA